jgi:hypothetical protein
MHDTERNLPIGFVVRCAHDECSTSTLNDTMIVGHEVDDHPRVAVLIDALRFDSEKHDVEFKTNTTQSEFSEH